MFKDPRPKDLSVYVNKFRAVFPPDLVAQASDLEPKIPREVTVESGLEPYQGPWTSQQVVHLLRRTMFGVTKVDLNYFADMTMDQAVETLLREPPDPAPPVNDYNRTDSAGTYEDPNVPFGAKWVKSKWDVAGEGYKVNSMKAWNVRLFIEQSRSLKYKMYFFWHNHFVTQSWDVYFGKASWQYFKLLWDSGFGNFKELARKVTLDPAMLLYLNGAHNNKDAPDENYARELQELFCIGKGPNAKFTEGDVQAAARVLTGWSVDWEAYNSNYIEIQHVFRPWAHDSNPKQFSKFYGNREIQGRSGVDGKLELDELLDMIFENQETALFICRKLYRFFVYNIIDESTEKNIIQPLAKQLRDNNYAILPVLRTLLKSAHFHDPLNHGVLIKSPLDAIIGFWRMTDVKYNGNTDRPRYLNSLGAVWQMSSLGLEINDPPSVSGWPAYYQLPSYDKLWITTQTIGSRTAQTDAFIYWGFWNPSGEGLKANMLDFTDGLENPEDPDALLEEVIQLAMGVDITPEAKTFLKNILLSGQNNDSYWRDAWVNYKNFPYDQPVKSIVENRLKNMYQNLFHLAEYQLM